MADGIIVLLFSGALIIGTPIVWLLLPWKRLAEPRKKPAPGIEVSAISANGTASRPLTRTPLH
jgi:hypothetical protein